jgi:hypothetical protein
MPNRNFEIKKLKYIQELDREDRNDCIETHSIFLAKNGLLQNFIKLNEKGYEIRPHFAAKAGQLEILQYLDKSSILDVEECAEAAAATDQIEVLEWLLERQNRESDTNVTKDEMSDSEYSVLEYRCHKMAS